MLIVERVNEVSRPRRSAALIAGSIALFGLAACSSDDQATNRETTASTLGESSTTEATTTSATTTALTTPTRPKPSGPVAKLSAELTAGNGVYIGEGTTDDLDRAGYEQHEYVASGTAASYRAVGELGRNGRWKFEPDDTARFRTRVLVRAPADPAMFSGTVIVEWLNVSGGVDANPDWVTLREEIVRAGDAWVGVSAQRIGVEGGPVLVKVEGVAGAEDQGKGLKAIDPARYGTLKHPGDGYSFDIFTQVARAVGTGEGLGGLSPQRVIAAGESQSAFALVSYINGVQPIARAFDGFFVHSRGASGLPLVAAGQSADIAGSIGGTATIFRTDQDVPILDLQTETDVASILNSFAARQPDSLHFRLWEVAGAAHADAHLMGAGAKSVDCGVPINDGPLHIVAKAALRALNDWVATGTAPVKAPRIKMTPGASPQVRRDVDGIALGGIRTPPVDVPVAALSGAPGPNPSTICLLLGSTKPLTAARIAKLYSSRAEYERRYAARADAAITAGFVLAEDRAALLEFSRPSIVQ